LVRVLLEASAVTEARAWMQRIDRQRPVPVPVDSLAWGQWRLSEAMIDLRAGDTDPLQILSRLQEVEGVPHPRVTGGDLRLGLLRCLFEAHELAGQYRQALEFQRCWSHAKARLRTHLAREHEHWTRETLAGLRAEADEFVTCALRAPLLAAVQTLGKPSTGELADEVATTSLRRARHSVARAVDIADQYLGVVRAEHRARGSAAADLATLVDMCEQMAPAGAPSVWARRRASDSCHRRSCVADASPGQSAEQRLQARA
jgi:hypothetical protein